MEVALGTLEHYATGESRKLGRLAHALTNRLGTIFGCQHRELSRPFSRRGESYRVCLACGAQQRFDEVTWNTKGPFYYRVANPSDLLECDVSALKQLALVKTGK